MVARLALQALFAGVFCPCKTLTSLIKPAKKLKRRSRLSVPARVTDIPGRHFLKDEFTQYDACWWTSSPWSNRSVAQSSAYCRSLPGTEQPNLLSCIGHWEYFWSLGMTSSCNTFTFFAFSSLQFGDLICYWTCAKLNRLYIYHDSWVIVR